MFLNSRRVTLIRDRVVAGVTRRPVDRLIPEWAAARSYVSKMQYRVPSLYTYRYNLFDHTGPGAGDETVPKCFGDNIILHDEEQFDFKMCATLVVCLHVRLAEITQDSLNIKP